MRPASNTEAEAFAAGACPACGARTFREGPSAGLASNWICEACGVVLNVAHVEIGAAWPILLELADSRTNAALAAIPDGPRNSSEARGRGPSFAELDRLAPQAWRP
jgi:hypothetical protein